MKIKKVILTLSLAAMLLGMTLGLTACGGSGLLSFDWAKKNHFDASKARIGYEEVVTIDNKTVTFTAPEKATDFVSAKVEIEVAEGKSVKLTADVVKKTIPSTASFIVRIGYEDLDAETVKYEEVTFFKNGKSLLPITFKPDSETFKIVNYQFRFDGVTAGAETAPYIQLQNIRLIAVS